MWSSVAKTKLLDTNGGATKSIQRTSDDTRPDNRLEIAPIQKEYYVPGTVEWFEHGAALAEHEAKIAAEKAEEKNEPGARRTLLGAMAPAATHH